MLDNLILGDICNVDKSFAYLGEHVVIRLSKQKRSEPRIGFARRREYCYSCGYPIYAPLL